MLTGVRTCALPILGSGIVLAMLVAMGLLAYGDSGQAVAMALAAAGLLLVAGIGWLDDHRPLTPWSRLAVHAVASCLLGIVAIGAGGQFASALFAFLLAMVLVNIWNFMDGIDGIAALQALVVAGGCALLAGDPASRWMAVGLVCLDGRLPRSPGSRLWVDAGAACRRGIVSIGACGQFASALFAFLLAMVLVNIWNFMDGIAGIAALQALVVAGGCALLAGDPASRWMALALAAACLGFLPLNLPRARIFLGDAGSGALGYALALVIVLAAVGGGEASSPAARMLLLLPPSAFLVDAALDRKSTRLHSRHSCA